MSLIFIYYPRFIIEKRLFFLMFELQTVSVQLNDKPVLNNISVKIQPQQVTTLLGHNGCGKSTLVKLLARQVRPDSGQILLDGQPLESFSQKALARKVAYLPQHPPITDGVTVRELVAYGRYPWTGALGRHSSEDEAIIDEAIEQLQLQDFSHRFVATLSGGERQRAWVALLLAQKTQVVILDEPISALDIAHQFELVRLIYDQNDLLQLTVVMVLHDINLASRFSDQIIAMKAGQIITQDAPENIMNQATLEEIYGIELGLFPHPSTKQPISFLL